MSISMICIRNFALPLVYLLLAHSFNGYGQTATIDQIRTQLMTPPGCTVQKSGLWATTNVMESPSEIKIDGGKIARGSAAYVHGKTNVQILPGQLLRVLEVSGSSDAKGDLVRVTVQAAGLALPIVFVFPKGSLNSTEAAPLMATISAVLQPPVHAAPVIRARTANQMPSPPLTAPVATPQLPFVKWSEPFAGLQTSFVKAACESSRNADQALCYSVLASFQDAQDMAADSQMKLFAGCIPAETTAQQIKDAFLDETKVKPDQLLGPISIFYGITLDDKFPCPKSPARHAATKKPTH